MKKAELHFPVIMLFLTGLMLFALCLEATRLYFAQNKMNIFTREMVLELERRAYYNVHVRVHEQHLRKQLHLQNATLEHPTEKMAFNTRFTVSASLDYSLNFLFFKYPVRLTSTAHGKVHYYLK